jgi:hypothetical protein
MWSDVTDWLSGAGENIDWGNVLALGGSYALNQSGANTAQSAPTGYQGSIPTYEAVRTPVQVSLPENYRPGSGGRRYFSDVRYAAPENAAAERTAAQEQAEGLAALNQTSPFVGTRPAQIDRTPQGDTSPIVSRAPARVIEDLPVPQQQGLSNYSPQYAEGGIARLAKGRYLNGESDGMADEVRANIDGKQEARLSDGEYVIPADVVSHLGNGNSDAGAKVLDQLLSRVRKERTGNEKQGKEIDPRKIMPA